jgi:hypothetical protein
MGHRQLVPVDDTMNVSMLVFSKRPFEPDSFPRLEKTREAPGTARTRSTKELRRLRDVLSAQ